MTESDVRQIVMEMIGRFDDSLANNVVAFIDGGRQIQAGHQGVNAMVRDPYTGDIGAVTGASTGFPKRAYDPFRWAWNSDTMTLTIGNIRLYNSSGAFYTKADTDTVLAEGDTWLFMTYTHDGGALDIGTASSENDAQTTESDIAAGIQKYPLYHFTVTGTSCVCAMDYIHHGAIGTTFR